MSLFANIFGDFGAAGMPGTFKRFFVDVVVNMARSVRVLTLPMPVYVDDCALIAPLRSTLRWRRSTSGRGTCAAWPSR